jgi:hypothetical protein
LTDVHLTWRYSPNSEIVTVVVHKVNNNFPENAKIKFKCGKRFADSRHHPDINENKIEIKVKIVIINLNYQLFKLLLTPV